MAHLTAGLHDLGVSDLLQGYRARRFSPVDVVDRCLEGCDDGDPENFGLVTVPAGRARAEAAASAERWAAGRPLALDGVPFGAKDLIATAGVRTSLGSARWTDWIPDRDATCVARLRSAGAVLVAKLATPELGFGDARVGHRPANPWATGHWTGGSSSGPAVALASGRLPLALGTDTGGSIRVPASYCGVTGLKPTFGLVPCDGVATVSWTLDHVGPMARSVDDVALALDVLTDTVAGPLERSGAGVRVGVPRAWFQEQVDDDAWSATASAADVLSSLGAEVCRDVELPDADLGGIAAWVITVAEFAEVHADWRDHVSSYTPAAAERLAAGSTVSAGDYLRALRVRTHLRAGVARLLEEVDVILTPATPTAAPRIAPPMHEMFGDGDRMWLERVARNLIVFNLLGLPALVVPAGRTPDGRPLAVQIVGRHRHERQVLSIAAAFQDATGHHRAAPPVEHPTKAVT